MFSLFVFLKSPFHRVVESTVCEAVAVLSVHARVELNDREKNILCLEDLRRKDAICVELLIVSTVFSYPTIGLALVLMGRQAFWKWPELLTVGEGYARYL